MKNFFILFFFILSIASIAQVPGYFGKRNYVSYSVWMHPNVNLLGEPFNTKGTQLDVTHAFAIDHVVSWRGALCLSYHFCSMGMSSFDELGYYDNDNYIYLGKDKYSAYLHSRCVSIGYKLFAHDKIAPLGKYIKWDAFVIFNKLVYKPEDVYDIKRNARLTSVDEDVKSIGGGIALCVGRQRIFYDKIVVDGGLRFALAVCPSNYASGYANRYFYATERTIFNQAINCRLGIGFLAF